MLVADTQFRIWQTFQYLNTLFALVIGLITCNLCNLWRLFICFTITSDKQSLKRLHNFGEKWLNELWDGRSIAASVLIIILKVVRFAAKCFSAEDDKIL